MNRKDFILKISTEMFSQKIKMQNTEEYFVFGQRKWCLSTSHTKRELTQAMLAMFSHFHDGIVKSIIMNSKYLSSNGYQKIVCYVSEELLKGELKSKYWQYANKACANIKFLEPLANGQ